MFVLHLKLTEPVLFQLLVDNREGLHLGIQWTSCCCDVGVYRLFYVVEGVVIIVVYYMLNFMFKHLQW